MEDGVLKKVINWAYYILTLDMVRDHKELKAYTKAFTVCIRIFELSKKFPKEELYSLTDQIRRSSRSVCANIAEAFRKRRYKKALIAKLSDAEAEAAETQVWLDFALRSCYINKDTHLKFKNSYDQIIGKIIRMINTADKWSF